MSKKQLYGVFNESDLSKANLNETQMPSADLSGVTYNSKTTWGDITWDNTTCPDGTNSDDPGNSTCRF